MIARVQSGCYDLAIWHTKKTNRSLKPHCSGINPKQRKSPPPLLTSKSASAMRVQEECQRRVARLHVGRNIASPQRAVRGLLKLSGRGGQRRRRASKTASGRRGATDAAQVIVACWTPDPLAEGDA